uniref:Uncharacterized protein n=1 Tax=Eutreptiella gymnastica TaxID=73025 RepID=A0A7S1IYW2_9EUGL
MFIASYRNNSFNVRCTVTAIIISQVIAPPHLYGMEETVQTLTLGSPVCTKDNLCTGFLFFWSRKITKRAGLCSQENYLENTGRPLHCVSVFSHSPTPVWHMYLASSFFFSSRHMGSTLLSKQLGKNHSAVHQP